ncbi:MAG: creatininase family protein, partial [Sulfolobaceae archaeon]
NYMLDVLNSLKQLFRAVVIINGHGGNESVLDVIRRQVNFTNDDFKVYIFNIPGKNKELFNENDMHAGSLESSEVKAINPDLVRDEKLREVKDYTVKKGVFETVTAPQANPYGIINIGGGVKIDKEKGERALKLIIKELKELVEEILREYSS